MVPEPAVEWLFLGAFESELELSVPESVGFEVELESDPLAGVAAGAGVVFVMVTDGVDEPAGGLLMITGRLFAGGA